MKSILQLQVQLSVLQLGYFQLVRLFLGIVVVVLCRSLVLQGLPLALDGILRLGGLSVHQRDRHLLLPHFLHKLLILGRQLPNHLFVAARVIRRRLFSFGSLYLIFEVVDVVGLLFESLLVYFVDNTVRTGEVFDFLVSEFQGEVLISRVLLKVVDIEEVLEFLLFGLVDLLLDGQLGLVETGQLRHDVR